MTGSRDMFVRKTDGIAFSSKENRLRKTYKQVLHNTTGKLHNGWKIVAISGTSYERGYSHGKKLYKELREVVRYLPFLVKLDFKTTLDEYIDRCSRLFEPILTSQYREYYEELEGIHKGALSMGVDVSVKMLIAWNAFLSMYGEYDKGSSENTANDINKPVHRGRCSAFIATGNATEKGDIVMGHNTHCNYALAALSNIILYVYPDKGHAFCMQTCAGLLCSSMDWFVCDNGMIGCETTIYGIKYKPQFGSPYFCRIRDCMQYRNSLDEYADTMLVSNAGDYACSWLFGDTRTGEIMLCEIGLMRHNIQKTQNGAFYSANSAIDDSLRRLETTNTVHDNIQHSIGARNERFNQLLFHTYKGRVNVSNAKRILADHYDVFEDRIHPGVRTICKHTDLSNDSLIKNPWYPQGAIDGKVINTSMASKMSFWGKFGSSCNIPFRKRAYLAKHPEYAEWRDFLVDLPNQPWTPIGRMPEQRRDRKQTRKRT
jgi:hypothetical protein